MRIQCKECHSYFDDDLAMGICPYCGAEIESDINGPIISEIKVTVPLTNNTKSQVDIKATVPLNDDNSGGSQTKPLFDDYEASDDPRWLLPGTILNSRYEVRSVIGVGGFGVTYKVWDHKHKVAKAVKEYFQQGVVNRIPGTTEIIITAPKRREEFEYGKKRLLLEAQIVAKFQSAAIVSVDDFFEENNTAYMVMEYLETQTLEDFIKQNKQVLNPEMAIDIGVHICEALEEIHAAGVVHRDIAPDNIFIDKEGRVKIIDFGSSRLSKEDFDDRMIVLKPGFAPPEQYEKIDPANDRQKAWTDVYALGATLYLALTGVLPAESSDRKADYDKHTDRVCDPKDINPNIPDFLNNTIMTAMAINIHERFQDASEFKAALLQERPVLPLEEVRKRKRLKRTVGISGAFLLAFIMIVFGVQWYNHRKKVEILEPANVSIWYALSENSDLATEKEEVMGTIKQHIVESEIFANINVEIKGISEDDYEEELIAARNRNEEPTLYEVLDTEAEYVENAVDLDSVYEMIEKDNCYYVVENKSAFTGKVFPTAFNIPIIYVNTSYVTDDLDEENISSMEDFMALCEGEMQYKPIAYNSNTLDTFARTLDGFDEYEESFDDYSKDDFLNGRAAAYFSDTSDYFEVRNELPGYFTMLLIDSSKVTCQFANYWSMSDSDEAASKAAERIMAYFLSNNVQDSMYLQSNISGLPLEKKALHDYIDVRLSFSKLLTDEKIDSYVFK